MTATRNGMVCSGWHFLVRMPRVKNHIIKPQPATESRDTKNNIIFLLDFERANTARIRPETTRRSGRGGEKWRGGAVRSNEEVETVTNRSTDRRTANTTSEVDS